APIDRTPRRVPVLGRGERELGIDLEGLAEFRAALRLAARDAMAECEVLARARGIHLRQQPVLERAVERLHRVVEFAVVVLLDAEHELLVRARAQAVLGDLRGGRSGLGRHLGATRDDERGEGCGEEAGRNARVHWNRWRTVTSSRALRSRVSL